MAPEKLRVLIVSRMGAHQKAIQAICAAHPSVSEIETTQGINEGLEAVKMIKPNLVILASNLIESQVCDFLTGLKTIPEPPYSVVITESELESCTDQYLTSNQIISARQFANRLPEILEGHLA